MCLCCVPWVLCFDSMPCCVSCRFSAVCLCPSVCLSVFSPSLPHLASPLLSLLTCSSSSHQCVSVFLVFWCLIWTLIFFFALCLAVLALLLLCLSFLSSFGVAPFVCCSSSALVSIKFTLCFPSSCLLGVTALWSTSYFPQPRDINLLKTTIMSPTSHLIWLLNGEGNVTLTLPTLYGRTEKSWLYYYIRLYFPTTAGCLITQLLANKCAFLS